jgi:hypothetical protein
MFFRKPSFDAKEIETKAFNMSFEAMDFVDQVMPHGPGNRKEPPAEDKDAVAKHALAKDALEAADKIYPVTSGSQSEAHAALAIVTKGGTCLACSMLSLWYLCLANASNDQFHFKFKKLKDVDHCYLSIVDTKTNIEIVVDPWLHLVYKNDEANRQKHLQQVYQELKLPEPEDGIYSEDDKHEQWNIGDKHKRMEHMLRFLVSAYEFKVENIPLSKLVEPATLKAKLLELRAKYSEHKLCAPIIDFVFSKIVSKENLSLEMMLNSCHEKEHFKRMSAYTALLAIAQYCEAIEAGVHLTNPDFSTDVRQNLIQALKLVMGKLDDPRNEIDNKMFDACKKFEAGEPKMDDLLVKENPEPPARRLSIWGSGDDD